MTLRTFQAGDEAAQVAIYNAAAASLPRFKPASVDEVRRRVAATDFDPASRLYAVADGEPVGYATFSDSGRVGYPWCRPGFESHAGPLFDAVLAALRSRGVTAAWAAYRTDWKPVGDFFAARGFPVARRMLNFALDLVEMPTVSNAARPATTPLRPEDLPALLAACPGLVRGTAAELERHLFRNRFFGPESAFAVRDRDGAAAAAAVLVANPAYADPKAIDAQMPCFRLGAWGTEGLTHKRIHGVFSVLAPASPNGQRLSLDLLAVAAERLEAAGGSTLAAQVADDQPHLVRFYQSYFRAQGSFPIYQRTL